LKPTIVAVTFTSLLLAQIPHPVPHPVPRSVPHEHIVSERSEQEKDRDRATEEHPLGGVRQVFSGDIRTPAEIAVFRDIKAAGDPLEIATRLQTAFRDHNYKPKPTAAFVEQLRQRYRAESNPPVREALKNDIKLAEYASWTFQAETRPNGTINSWLAIQDQPRAAYPVALHQGRNYAVYLEDHTSLAAADSGPQIVSAASLAVSSGKLKALLLHHPQAAAVFADFIYDQSTSKTFKRITPDDFEENPRQKPDCSGQERLSSACNVVLLLKTSR